jgi:hypothetical protein
MWISYFRKYLRCCHLHALCGLDWLTDYFSVPEVFIPSKDITMMITSSEARGLTSGSKHERRLQGNITTFFWIDWRKPRETSIRIVYIPTHNDDIYKMYKDLALATYRRLKKLMWAGHVVRMEQHRITKKVLGSCFGGGRPVGRPWNRWEDVIQSRGSSVSIVSDYGLDDRAIGVLSQAGAKDFSSNFCDQTGSEAHPASCTMGTGGSFPRGKARSGRDADHSPHLVPRSGMSRSYTSSPPKRLRGV